MYVVRVLVNLDRDEGIVLYFSGVYFFYFIYRLRLVLVGRVKGDIIMYNEIVLKGFLGMILGEFCYIYMYLFR